MLADDSQNLFGVTPGLLAAFVLVEVDVHKTLRSRNAVPLLPQSEIGFDLFVSRLHGLRLGCDDHVEFIHHGKADDRVFAVETASQRFTIKDFLTDMFAQRIAQFQLGRRSVPRPYPSGADLLEVRIGDDHPVHFFAFRGRSFDHGHQKGQQSTEHEQMHQRHP